MATNLSISNFNIKVVKIAIIKSIVKNLLIFSPLILGMILVNYFVDPAGLFRGGGYENGIVKIFMQGLNVANASNYNERLLQLCYINADKKPKDTIVLGSSRVKQINADNFNSENFFNHGISCASLEDFFTICEMYEEKNKLPSTIILGLDPWILNKNNDLRQWQFFRDYYFAFINRLQGGKTVDTFFSRYNYLMFEIKQKLNLISPSYFGITIRYLVRHIPELIKTGRIKMDYYPTKLDNANVANRLDVNILVADGTLADGKDSILKMRADVKNYITHDPVYFLGGFYELDKENQQNFEKFVEYLLKRNTKVIFFIPPFHPYVYKYLMDSTRYQIIAKAETYFRTIGSQKRIKVIGSYDPLQCGLKDEDFLDGVHPTREAVDKLTKFIKPWKTKSEQFFESSSYRIFKAN